MIRSFRKKSKTKKSAGEENFTRVRKNNRASDRPWNIVERRSAPTSAVGAGAEKAKP